MSVKKRTKIFLAVGALLLFIAASLVFQVMSRHNAIAANKSDDNKQMSARSSDGTTGGAANKESRRRLLTSSYVPKDPKSAARLPPSGTPVAAMYDDLREQAEEGSAVAQCRLGSELYRCALLAREHKSINDELYGAALKESGSAEEARLTNRIQAQLTELEPFDKACEGVTQQQIGEPWRYLLNSANQGNVSAMLMFAVNPPLDQTNFLNDIEGWQAYRQNAGMLLMRAAALGDPRALYYMFWALANYPVPGGAAILPRDAVHAVGYALAARALADTASQTQIDRAIIKLSAEIGPIGMADAQRFAETVKVGASPSNTPSDFIGNLMPSPDDCEPQ